MKLALLFTRKVSLTTWVSQGLYDREMSFYNELFRRGEINELALFTYGAEDKNSVKELKAAGKTLEFVTVFPMHKFFTLPIIGSWLYSIVLPFIYADVLKGCDLIKTNQLDGAWTGSIVRFLFKKKLILRCGYIPSSLLNGLKKNQGWRYYLRKKAEGISYYFSDCCIVAGESDKQYVRDNFRLNKNAEIHVVPNFIDGKRFTSLDHKKDNQNQDTILYVGRLSSEKNLRNLIKASTDVGLKLDLVGAGKQEKELRQYAAEVNGQVSFLGTIENVDMPKLHCKYQYFALVSFYEGNPKALIEAMASGLICIGSNVAGITQIINHGETGYIAQSTSPDDIAAAIGMAIKYGDEKVGKKAQEIILNKFDLTYAVEVEAAIYKKLLAQAA